MDLCMEGWEGLYAPTSSASSATCRGMKPLPPLELLKIANPSASVSLPPACDVEMSPFFPLSSGRRWAACFLLASFVLGAVRLSAAAASASPPAVLTTASQVRALTEEEARGAVPVRLRGVYMGEADPEGIAFVIQDETEGIYVQGPAEQVAGLARGDLLEIE